MSAKGLNSIKVAPRLEAKLPLPSISEVPKPLSRINTVDLDSRFYREASGRVEAKKPLGNKIKDILRPIID